MKMVATDADLLRQFARGESQDAFAEIVRRHLDLVHSAALRQVRSAQLAEEIAQSVFADLSREAGKLKADTILTAWLYAVTRRTAVDVIRKESRRQRREQIAAELNAMNSTKAGWMDLEPLLDEAMAALDETDRAAVLLRFFENKSLREVGGQLGVSDDAAQKRVGRAVEKLREFLSKHNVTMGASGLAILISANAVQSAPASLAVSIGATALTGTAVAGSTVIAATKTIAMTTLQKIIVGAALVAAVGTGIYEAHQGRQLREQMASLRAQANRLQAENKRLAARAVAATPHLPAPAIQIVTQVVTNGLPDSADATNFWAKLNDKPAKITREQADAFLNANGRNAANLLAAYRTSGDPALLAEAMKKFPNDPQVAFEAAEATTLHQLELAPEEQRQWLDAFEKSAPNNSLAN
jgi:RNA polymerase sigma factor (sigma-70 family)